MVESEDPELTSFNAHTETTTTSIATDSENTLKTGRTDHPQLVIEKRSHQKRRKGKDVVRNQTPGIINYKWKGHCKHRGERRSDCMQGTSAPRDLHWEDKSL